MSDNPTRIKVAAGILRDVDGRVLLTERLGDTPFSGLWEFPGGKLEAGETPAIALLRELQEELGIQIVSFDHYLNIQHDYPDRRVEIDFFLVSHWDGQPSGLQGQKLNWLPVGLLDENFLLAADAPVVRLLQSANQGG